MCEEAKDSDERRAEASRREEQRGGEASVQIR